MDLALERAAQLADDRQTQTGTGTSSPAARSNSLNTRSVSDCAMPTPVSATRMDHWLSEHLAMTSSISPSWVYFVAFDSRFSAT